MIRAIVLTVSLSLLAAPVIAQHAEHSDSMPAAFASSDAAALPLVCRASDVGHTMVDSGGVGAGALRPTSMPSPAHQAMADSMMAMHDDMLMGMMAGDFDVAFVCGMIPHHQGAIAMARAVIENGDEEWTKSLAREIIAAQEKEIAVMESWLEARSDSQIVSEKVRRACREGFSEAEGALGRTSLDARTRGQVDALLKGIDAAENSGDVAGCQEKVATLRQILHLDH
jgi:hypothetical protein